MPSVSWASEGHATGSWDPPVQGNYLCILFPWFCDFSQGEHTSILEESWRNRKIEKLYLPLNCIFYCCPVTFFSALAIRHEIIFQVGKKLNWEMGSFYHPVENDSCSHAFGILEALSTFTSACNKLFADLVLAPNTHLLLPGHQGEHYAFE